MHIANDDRECVPDYPNGGRQTINTRTKIDLVIRVMEVGPNVPVPFEHA